MKQKDQNRNPQEELAVISNGLSYRCKYAWHFATEKLRCVRVEENENYSFRVYRAVADYEAKPLVLPIVSSVEQKGGATVRLAPLFHKTSGDGTRRYTLWEERVVAFHGLSENNHFAYYTLQIDECDKGCAVLRAFTSCKMLAERVVMEIVRRDTDIACLLDTYLELRYEIFREFWQFGKIHDGINAFME